MRPAAQVQAAIELLEEVIQSAYPADRIMSQYFRNHRYIGSKDKAAVSEYLYTVLRNRLSYEYLLSQADFSKDSRFLVAVMLLAQGQSLGAVFDGQKHNPQAFSESVFSKLKAINFSDLDDAPLNVQLNVPAWIAPKLEAALGQRYAEEMRASNLRATTDIRVNTLKSSVAQTQQVLSQAGQNCSPTPLSALGLRFDTRVALFGTDSFKQGWFEIQDEGSQVLAAVTQATAGDKVVDFCAGAGGKTLALAAMMKNKGSLYACDVHTKRLDELAKRTKRAGAHNVRTHVLSSENDKWVKQHKAIADVVLIDAPCTGTGTWRRSPDSRWNLTPENLDNLVKLQHSILNSASRLVKPGGKLFYATCSLLNQENEDQIANFLEINPQFEKHRIELPSSLSENLDKVEFKEHQLRMYPGLSSTDGFYVACLLRKPN